MSLGHAILGFLSRRPMTGYELKTRCFDQVASHFWTADQAQIYRTLDAIDTYKVQATETMAATAESLTAELQQASAYLERSRSQGALEGGLA